MNAKARICKNLEALRSKWGWCKGDVPFPRIESFASYINFLKRKVTNVAILSNIYLEITKVMIVCYIFLKKNIF